MSWYHKLFAPVETALKQPLESFIRLETAENEVVRSEQRVFIFSRLVCVYLDEAHLNASLAPSPSPMERGETQLPGRLGYAGKLALQRLLAEADAAQAKAAHVAAGASAD